MLIGVIPIDISFWTEYLTYFVADDLYKYIQVWSIVKIPFKNNIIYWLVSEKQIDYSWEIKSIVDIVCSFPILSQYQIDLIYKISNKYFLPISQVLWFFLPKYIFNKLEKNSFSDTYNIEIKTNKKVKTWKINYFHIINKNLDDFIIDSLNNIEDTVLIFWDDFSYNNFVNKFKINENIWLFSNKLSYTKKYNFFIWLLSWKYRYVIWTRKLLSFNLWKYSNIYYIEDNLLQSSFINFNKISNFDIINSMYLSWFNVNILTTLPNLGFLYKVKTNKFSYKII